jgi:hypothetical protein
MVGLTTVTKSGYVAPGTYSYYWNGYVEAT